MSWRVAKGGLLGCPHCTEGTLYIAQLQWETADLCARVASGGKIEMDDDIEWAGGDVSDSYYACTVCGRLTLTEKEERELDSARYENCYLPSGCGTREVDT